MMDLARLAQQSAALRSHHLTVFSAERWRRAKTAWVPTTSTREPAGGAFQTPTVSLRPCKMVLGDCYQFSQGSSGTVVPMYMEAFVMGMADQGFDLFPPDVKSRLVGKDPEAGKD